MEFEEFCEGHSQVWDDYLGVVYSDIVGKKAKLGEGILLFPNMVIYTVTEHHYLAELFGASPEYKGLASRRHSESSTIRYLYQFADLEGEPAFFMNSRDVSLSTLIISRDIDINKVRDRFGINPSDSVFTILRRRGEGGSLLSFGPEFQSCYLNNCFLLNTYGQIYRMKYVLHLSIISKAMSLRHFLQDMTSKHVWPVSSTWEMSGVAYRRDNAAWKYTLSGQFANLFLVPGLREPNIGKFLSENPELVKRSLGCVDFLYEQRLYWKEGNWNPGEQYIQPDFLLKAANGYWDICDLKKPIIERESITKGGHSRRRFIDYVQEGLAQLANYEQYFQFKENAEYAKQEFGILVDKPRLILIVGNYENVDIEEIQEAERMLKTGYSIMDYDSMNTSFLLRTHPA